MYFVVVFEIDDRVAVIPNNWYVESSNECFWPPSKIKEKWKAVKFKYSPDCDWVQFKIKVLGKFSKLYCLLILFCV